MTISKEERARNHRRRRRQMIGVLVCVLVLIGAATVIKGAAHQVLTLFDQSEEFAQYEDRLEGMVMFDPLPFASVQEMNDITLRSAAVWGTVYSIMDTENGLTAYTRDAETDMVLLPGVEVDAYLAKLLGAGFRLEHKTFTMADDDMEVAYDESRQCYLIPVTSMLASYTPKVEKLFKQAGLLYVTVGYVPMADNTDLTATAVTEPVKYMDYVFARSSSSWYLTALQESETKPEVTPAPTAAPVQPEGDVDTAIIAGVTGEEPVPSTQPEQSAGSEIVADSAAQ